MSYIKDFAWKLTPFARAVFGASEKIVEDTATGNPVTFQTDLAKPLRSLVANFLPVQASGTPSPDNILPITGWTGVNVQSSGENVLNSSAPQIIDVSGQGVNRYGQVFRSAGKYTIVNNSESYDYLYFKKVKNDLSSYGGANTVNHGQNAKVTLEENYMLYVYRQAGSDMSDFCVNIGEDTVFHAYTGQTYPASFSSTIYGGYVDMVTGEVWKTWETVDMGSLRWLATGTSTTGVYRMYTPSLADVIEIPESNSVVGKVVCSVYQSRSADSTYSKNMGVSVGRNKSVLVYDADYNEETSVDDFKTSVTGQTLAYGLASPVLITTLTPQQINAIKGNNTLWSDANGSMTCVYLVSSKYADEHPVGGLGFGFGFGLGSGTPNEPDDPENPDEPEEPDIDDSENNQTEGEEP